MALDVPELRPAADGRPRMRTGPAAIGASIGVLLALGALALALLLKGKVVPAPLIVVPTVTLPADSTAPTGDAGLPALPPDTTGVP